jgi:4'-phosphopantetheinyl transferase
VSDGPIELSYTRPERLGHERSLAICRGLLSPEEWARHDRLVRSADRHRFRVAHALVRLTLSGHAEVAPGDWRFRRGHQGRPEIAGHAQAPGLSFNLTHTPGLCACAVARGVDVGVDAERTDRRIAPRDVARRFFPAADADRLERMPARDRRRAFFAHWTLREAYVKARGESVLRLPREALSFRLEGPGAPAVAFAAGWTDDPACWRFFQVQPGGLHRCAVAARCANPGALSLRVREAKIESGSPAPVSSLRG